MKHQRLNAVILAILSLPLTGCFSEVSTANAPSSTATSSISPSPVNFSISGVSLDSSSLTLNAPPPSGEPDAGYETSATLVATVKASDNGEHAVAWTSSSPSMVTVSNGYVKTVANARESVVTITARSVDDPSKFAIATVSVTIFGAADIEVL